jgi:hypothetical protein
MSNYKGILFQREREAVRNSAEWGCYVSDSPYIPVPQKAKNITSQSWKDEHGDDEYIPETLYYEPVEATLSFVFKGKVTDAKMQITAFINYLQAGYFKFYDEFYKVGRQRVRVLNVPNDVQFQYDDITKDTGVASFSIEVKINDAVTDITLAL